MSSTELDAAEFEMDKMKTRLRRSLNELEMFIKDTHFLSSPSLGGSKEQVAECQTISQSRRAEI
jgi:hypothetical protein